MAYINEKRRGIDLVERFDIDQVVRDFVTKGIAIHRIHSLDDMYAINRLLGILGKDSFDIHKKPSIPLPNLLDSMDRIVAYAVDNGLIQDTPGQIDILESQIMELITPLPSEVNKNFWNHYEEAPMRATDEFYRLSQDNNYIKTRQIAKNKRFTVDTEYGALDITINLSKPEKTREQMEIAYNTPASGYPACALCLENEGYKGREDAAARSNHRVVRIPLLGENWGFQYSPYSYYNEHCIIFTRHHVPMHVSEKTIGNLLEIVSLFPHYFVGSNAGLPIVGGSILSHEHYQGGRQHFPMEDAEVLYRWDLNNHPEVQAEILYWPLSVIRLRASDPDEIYAAGCLILDKWQTYSDPAADIVAETEGQKHNAVTIVARRKGEAYELDMVLRNNRTSEAFPDGIFHPHKDVQHIKKENIGLIEVLGLAILPPRLETELIEVAAYLLDRPNFIADYHKEWADEMKQTAAYTAADVMDTVRNGVGNKFLRVLEDAGVYKQTAEGQAALKRFLETLND